MHPSNKAPYDEWHSYDPPHGTGDCGEWNTDLGLFQILWNQDTQYAGDDGGLRLFFSPNNKCRHLFPVGQKRFFRLPVDVEHRMKLSEKNYVHYKWVEYESLAWGFYHGLSMRLGIVRLERT